MQTKVLCEFYSRYGQKVEHSKRTRTTAEKDAKAIAIGQDGFYLLDSIYAEDASASIRNLKAVEVLRQVWLQQYYAPTEGQVQLRSNKDEPPLKCDRILSSIGFCYF